MELYNCNIDGSLIVSQGIECLIIGDEHATRYNIVIVNINIGNIKIGLYSAITRINKYYTTIHYY